MPEICRSIIYISVFIFMSAVVFLAPPVLGQENNTESQVPETISQQDIDDLVVTLESETARQEFIQNLKTLSETQSEEDTESPSYWLTSTLGIEDQAEAVVKEYEAYLEDYNLNSSLHGKAGLSGLLLVGALLAAFLVHKASQILYIKLSRLRDNYGLRHNRFEFYTKNLRTVGYLLIVALAFFSLLIIWGVSMSGIFTMESGIDFLGNLLNILLILFLATFIWEAISTGLEYWMGNARGPKAQRLKTLLPITRNVLFVTFLLLFGFVILSELGINVVPLMAGAGVAGIAIGFGAQTIVNDFLNGFTVIFEDLFRVGDVVTIGDRRGLVEKISIRKVQMRDLSSIVYTIPFSKIDIVENFTKDFSYYLMDIGVAYREDTDEVVQHLKDIAEEMRGEDEFKDIMLEPIETLGVDQFADSAVVIKARLKTKPIEQWKTGREFNRRMKKRFDEKGVEIPFPHQTLYFGQEKDGSAPPAHVEMLEKPKEKTKAAKKEAA